MPLQSMCAHHMRSPTDKSEDEGIESRLSNSDSLVTAESQPLASRITSLSSSRKSGSFLSSNRINISSSSAFPRSPPLLAEFAKGARWFSSSSCTLAACCCRLCCCCCTSCRLFKEGGAQMRCMALPGWSSTSAPPGGSIVSINGETSLNGEIHDCASKAGPSFGDDGENPPAAPPKALAGAVAKPVGLDPAYGYTLPPKPPASPPTGLEPA